MKSVFVSKPPDWYNRLLPFPDDWGWKCGRMLRLPPNGLFQAMWLADLLQSFDFEQMTAERTAWFFQRGAYAIVQQASMAERLTHGLAFYPLERFARPIASVYHVTPRRLVDRIQEAGIVPGRQCDECSSSWREGRDFVHVWATRNQASHWPHNKKLRQVALGPWSLIEVEARSHLFLDPKSDAGGLIFGCGYAVPRELIRGVEDLEVGGES